MGNGENEQRTWSTKSTVSSRQWQNQMDPLPAHWLRGRAHEGLKEPALEEILDTSETYLNRIFEQLVEQNCKDFFFGDVSQTCASLINCVSLFFFLKKKRNNSLETSLKVWLVPKSWKRDTMADLTSLCASSSQDGLSVEEMTALTESGLFQTQCEPTPQAVQVKQELTPEEEKDAEAKQAETRAAKFRAGKRQLLATMQEQDLHCDIIKTKLEAKIKQRAPEVKYIADFQNDLAKHAKAMKKTVTMMQRFCANDEGLNEKELPRLIDACDQLAAKHKDIEHWAQKFGVDEQRQTTKRAKK